MKYAAPPPLPAAAHPPTPRPAPQSETRRCTPAQSDNADKGACTPGWPPSIRLHETHPPALPGAHTSQSALIRSGPAPQISAARVKPWIPVGFLQPRHRPGLAAPPDAPAPPQTPHPESFPLPTTADIPHSSAHTTHSSKYGLANSALAAKESICKPAA